MRGIATFCNGQPLEPSDYKHVAHGLIFLKYISYSCRRRNRLEHRPWFTPNEYEQLYKATRANETNPKKSRFKWHAEKLHDIVLLVSGGPI